MDHTAPSDLSFDHFLHRMRHPASADLVRAIKSFIVSFSFHTTNMENASRTLQDFLTMMEATIKDHPLWAHASDEEIDSAIEGLEKYIMTKLFNRTFASSPDDAQLDREILEKIRLLQHFIKPHHLDAPEVIRNEASLLFAAKELQKINAFKSPREKLLCVMNCCRVINNLLLNVSVPTDHIAAGADDFLPSLIYVTIKWWWCCWLGLQSHTSKANPPQLHSNIKFIQLFRRQSKLVSEVEYYLTNLISAKSFIADISARSLSMEESEFEKKMQSARSATEGTVADLGNMSGSSQDIVPTLRRHGEEIHIEGDEYPFMEADAGDLSVEDTRLLLGLYKQVVTRYTLLSKALSKLSLDESRLLISAEGDIRGNKIDIIRRKGSSLEMRPKV